MCPAHRYLRSRSDGNTCRIRHLGPRATCRRTRTDYTSWKILAWTGPVFLFAVFVLWGIVAHNMPPFPPSATPEQVKAHFHDFRLPLMIALSICVTMTAFYMSLSVAVARVMERVEGPNGLLSKLEMMGGTITCAPVMVTLAIWLTAAHEVDNLTPGIMHMLYWMGWLLFDLAYFVTSLQIAGDSIVFMRDKREKKLVRMSSAGGAGSPSCRSLWSVPSRSLTTGPLCLQRRDQLLDRVLHLVLLDPGLSYFIIKAVHRIKAEDEAAGRLNA